MCFNTQQKSWMSFLSPVNADLSLVYHFEPVIGHIVPHHVPPVFK